MDVSVGKIDGMVEGKEERILDGFLEGEAVRYLDGFADEVNRGERVGDIDGIGNSIVKGR